MERQIISINKELIPYKFDIDLGGEVFGIQIDYNSAGRFFTVKLSKNGTVLCEGEPIVYGVPLFRDIKDVDTFPSIVIIPYSYGDDTTTVTYGNLSKTVFLMIDDEENPILGGIS